MEAKLKEVEAIKKNRQTESVNGCQQNSRHPFASYKDVFMGPKNAPQVVQGNQSPKKRHKSPKSMKAGI